MTDNPPSAYADIDPNYTTPSVPEDIIENEAEETKSDRANKNDKSM